MNFISWNVVQNVWHYATSVETTYIYSFSFKIDVRLNYFRLKVVVDAIFLFYKNLLNFHFGVFKCLINYRFIWKVTNLFTVINGVWFQQCNVQPSFFIQCLEVSWGINERRYRVENEVVHRRLICASNCTWFRIAPIVVCSFEENVDNFKALSGVRWPLYVDGFAEGQKRSVIWIYKYMLVRIFV